ncbi:Zinc finger, C2H2 type [Popillia japonica]|uniref:Zinc finger, C2H2 type n=1 Tax=Popillia japonica TaxID=7064 RepID=A0AAW1KER2_POPJA
MNFSPFGGHFPAAIPTIHQFAAKFNHENAANPICQPPETNSNRYTANGIPSFTQHHPPQQHMLNSSKYQSTAAYMNQSVYSQPNNVRHEKRHYEHQELTSELCAAMLQQSQQQSHQQHEKRQNSEKAKDSHQEERRNHQQQNSQPQQGQVQSTPQSSSHSSQNQVISTTSSMPATWQSLATPGSTVADYLSHLPASTLPLSLHHFLKYSAETIKKETNHQQLNLPGNEPNLNLLHSNLTSNALNGNSLTTNTALTQNTNILSTNALSTLNSLSTINTSQLQSTISTKKKKKKKPEKEKKPKPKPGEIRLTTALDGSTLYCCPECHMAYPEKELLEQHLLGHTLERRFVCDICGAGLKRKDHLTRHKQSHNPERPYVCTVCLKAFKRKEQLTLHFVIHSGEKRHVCTECGKGFYRKDHLRKHTRSHIARRVKAELSQQGTSNTSSLQLQVAAPTVVNTSSGNTTQSIIS